jgi:hypothetical protein
MRNWSPALLAILLGACAEATQAPLEPEVIEEPGNGLRIVIAPLSVPGVGNVCYDFSVALQSGEVLWSVGNPGVSVPADGQAACSADFGVPDGSMVYAGFCDPTSPTHTIRLWVDSVWGPGADISEDEPLTDWSNPCPPPTGCALEAQCEADTYTNVTFDLAVMRRGQQGFFDIGVAFSDIFCSARLDCSYDAEGQDPITLLHNPSTGQREQTALLGLTCTAGSDAETELYASDVRVTCGSEAWAATQLQGLSGFCINDGSGESAVPEFFGNQISIDLEYDRDEFGTKRLSYGGSRWRRDSEGQYDRAIFPAIGADSLPWDGAVLEFPIGPIEEGGPLGIVATLVDIDPSRITNVSGSPFDSVMPAFTGAKTTLFARSNVGWEARQDLVSPEGVVALAALSIDPETKTLLAHDPVSNDGRLWIYQRLQDSSVTGIFYGGPRRVDVPSGWSCDFDQQVRHGLLVGSCNTPDGLKAVVTRLAEVGAGTSPVGPEVLLLPSESTLGGNGQRGADETRPLIVDGSHLLLQLTHEGQNRVGLATWTPENPTGYWSTSWAETDMETWLEAGPCLGERCLPWGANGANGLAWYAFAVRSGGGSMVTGRAMIAFSGAAQLSWTETDFGNQLSFSYDPKSMPLVSWQAYGSHYVLMPSSATRDGQLRLVRLGATSRSWNPIAANLDVPAELEAYGLRRVGTGVELYLRGPGLLAQVKVTGLDGGTAAVLMEHMPLDDSTRLVEEASNSLRLDDDVLNPTPCNTLFTTRAYSAEYNELEGQNISTTGANAFWSLEPQNFGELTRGVPMPKSAAAAQTWPLASVVRRQASVDFCVDEGGPEIIGGRFAYAADFTRNGLEVTAMPTSSVRWAQTQAGWVPTPLPAPQTPAVSEPQRKGLFLNFPAGRWPNDGSGALHAIGFQYVFDPARVRTDALEEGIVAAPVVARRVSGNWEVTQVPNVPAGLGLVMPTYLDAATQALIAEARGPYGTATLIYRRGGGAGQLLSYDSTPIIFEAPLWSTCGVLAVGQGVLAMRCERDGRPDSVYMIDLGNLPDSVLTRVPLELPNPPSNSDLAGYSPSRIESGAIVDGSHAVLQVVYESTNGSGSIRKLVRVSNDTGAPNPWTGRFHEASTAGESLMANRTGNGFYIGRDQNNAASFVAKSVDLQWRNLGDPLVAWTAGGKSLALVNNQVSIAQGGSENRLELVQLDNDGSALRIVYAVNTFGGFLEIGALRATALGYEALATANGSGQLVRIRVSLPASPGSPSVSLEGITGTNWPSLAPGPSQNIDLADDALNPAPCAGWLGTDYTDPDGPGVSTYWTEQSGQLVGQSLPDGLGELGLEGTEYAFQPESQPTQFDFSPAVGPGNAWAVDRFPDDPIWQFGTYRDNESFLCSAGACNKRYWNIALGFDPLAKNCSVEFMATAGEVGEFVKGSRPGPGAWPVIRFKAKLTGAQESDNVICRQNPLDGVNSGVVTDYMSLQDVQFCHGFDGTSVWTEPGCETVFPR